MGLKEGLSCNQSFHPRRREKSSMKEGARFKNNVGGDEQFKRGAAKKKKKEGKKKKKKNGGTK